MTCKDCIHYELCEVQAFNGFNENFEPEKDWKHCSVFKDKSKYIELPCKVGDRVYVICYKGNVQPYIRTETVLHMNYMQGESLTLWQIHTEYAVHNAKDVIYTKSEAEQKLKELKENS